MSTIHIWMFIALAVFIVASWFDAMSSMGMKERIPIFRDKEGRFDPKKYVTYSAVVIGLIMGFGWNWGSGQALIVLFAGAGMRFWAGLYYNPKQRKKSGLR